MPENLKFEKPEEIVFIPDSDVSKQKIKHQSSKELPSSPSLKLKLKAKNSKEFAESPSNKKKSSKNSFGSAVKQVQFEKSFKKAKAQRANYGKKRSSSFIKTEKFENIEEIEEKSESPICNRDKEMSSKMLIAR